MWLIVIGVTGGTDLIGGEYAFGWKLKHVINSYMYPSFLFGLIINEKSAEQRLTSFGLTAYVMYSTSFRLT